MTGQRGRIQSRATREDAPTVKRGRVLVPRLIGQTARARDTKHPPAEAPPCGTVNRGGRERSGRAGREAAAVARTVSDWAAGSYLHLVGGTGPSYPSLTVEADSGRTRGARNRGVLVLYASPHGGRPLWKSGSRGCAGRPVQDWPIEHATLSCGAPLR